MRSANKLQETFLVIGKLGSSSDVRHDCQPENHYFKTQQRSKRKHWCTARLLLITCQPICQAIYLCACLLHWRIPLCGCLLRLFVAFLYVAHLVIASARFICLLIVSGCVLPLFMHPFIFSRSIVLGIACLKVRWFFSVKFISFVFVALTQHVVFSLLLLDVFV